MTRVLALHCALASGAAWQGVGRHLPGREMICPDLPGHGRAPDWDPDRDFQAQALDRVLEEMGDEPVHVAGHSFGATLALRLFVEYPERVLSLALIEPVMFAAADEVALTDYLERMAPFEAAIADERFADAARIFHREWGGEKPFEDMSEPARESLTRRIFLIGAQEPAIVRDVHGVLPRLEARVGPPTLIVTREQPPRIMR